MKFIKDLFLYKTIELNAVSIEELEKEIERIRGLDLGFKVIEHSLKTDAESLLPYSIKMRKELKSFREWINHYHVYIVLIICIFCIGVLIGAIIRVESIENIAGYKKMAAEVVEKHLKNAQKEIVENIESGEY